jgi:tetratricopeptide (TPR) repeat protein
MNFRLVCASFVLFATACQSSSGDGKPIDRLSEVDRLSAHGEYAEALVVAEAYHRNHPDDEAGERQYRRARAAVMLDQARALCFADKNLEALEQVRQAMLIEPDESVIADWELKLTRKLAYLAAAAGDEQFASSDLDGAREQYELALSYAPDDVNAKAALSQVLLQINYRRGMGESYYEDGVHLLRDYWLEQARGRFSYTKKYTPKNTEAETRKLDVEAQLALSRCTLARDLERGGLWAGARNEYRIALLIDPDSSVAKEGFDRTRIEAEAEEKLREIDRLTRHKRYAEAMEMIQIGRTSTNLQADKFDGMAAGIEEAQLESSYSSAMALESDQKFEAAIAAYNAILERRDYYKDVLARRETLTTYVTKATGLYEQALATTDPQEKLRLLRQISVFWPAYKNTGELIELLRGATPADG